MPIQPPLPHLHLPALHPHPPSTPAQALLPAKHQLSQEPDSFLAQTGITSAQTQQIRAPKRQRQNGIVPNTAAAQNPQHPVPSKEAQESYKQFLTRLQLIRRSEIAEYNFGKPDNMAENPFRATWEALDRQHQALIDEFEGYRRSFPTATLGDFHNAYTRHYADMAHHGQAYLLEHPAAKAKRLEWLDKMMQKRLNPPTPLSTPWDLLHPSLQKIFQSADSYRLANPGASNQDFIEAYTRHYNDQARANAHHGMETPKEMASQLNWIDGLLLHLQNNPPG